jgi:hypothetical protein
MHNCLKYSRQIYIDVVLVLWRIWYGLRDVTRAYAKPLIKDGNYCVIELAIVYK